MKKKIPRHRCNAKNTLKNMLRYVLLQATQYLGQSALLILFWNNFWLAKFFAMALELEKFVVALTRCAACMNYNILNLKTNPNEIDCELSF